MKKLKYIKKNDYTPSFYGKTPFFMLSGFALLQLIADWGLFYYGGDKSLSFELFIMAIALPVALLIINAFINIVEIAESKTWWEKQ